MIPAILDDYRRTRVPEGASGGTVDRFDAPGRQTLFLKQGIGTVAADLADEWARLTWLNGRIAVPAIIWFERDADAAWLLTAAMDGTTIDTLAEREPGCVPALLTPLAAFLRTLHALPIADCPFDQSAPARLAAARAQIDAGLVDVGDFDLRHAGWSARQVWDEMATLRPPAFDRVVTHGDFSLGNVLVRDGRITGMIDVGRAGIADRYQDLAVAWRDLEDYGQGLGDQFLDAYGIDRPDRSRLAFHLCLDEFF